MFDHLPRVPWRRSILANRPLNPRRWLSIAAAAAFLGALLSGPIGLWLVSQTHPQPPWHDAETFASAFHPVQNVPYFAGFLLVGGFVAFIASAHASNVRECQVDKARLSRVEREK